jgi:predicted unusual protein kinase regulating ubiquinone biosynthesis (AarF/ABC1/UbiB family)
MAGVGMRVGTDTLLGRGDGSVTAERASEVLGQLRGVAAKVGQMAGYVDGVVPEDKRDAYQKWMTRLMDQAPTTPPDRIRDRLERELGAPVDTLFSEFDFEPIASASIGQVHRAITQDGTEVAVKVQHDGIDKAMESDLRNASLLEGAFKMFAGRKFESKRILDEIRARFREELDYGLEADRQRRFAEIFADQPKVVIPRVHDALSTGRVLTSDFVRGLKLDEAATAPEQQRREWAEVMWRFVYEGTLVGGMFNADPHPGNFFFGDDGSVRFLDFGCVQEVLPERRPPGIRTHRTASLKDVPAFEVAAAEMMELRGGRYQERAVAYMREAFRPQLESPFRITPTYVAGLAGMFKETFETIRKEKDDQYVAFQPGVFFLNRLQFGFYSVLARLDVAVDYGAVELEFLREP